MSKGGLKAKSLHTLCPSRQVRQVCAENFGYTFQNIAYHKVWC